MSNYKRMNDVGWNTIILDRTIKIRLTEFDEELLNSESDLIKNLNMLNCFIKIKIIEKCILIKLVFKSQVEWFELNYVYNNKVIYVIDSNCFNIENECEIFDKHNRTKKIKEFSYDANLEKIIEEFKIIAFNEYKNFIKTIIEKLRGCITELENIKNKAEFDYII